MSTGSVLRRGAAAALAAGALAGLVAAPPAAAAAGTAGTVRISAPQYDSPGALVPVIVTVVSPPAGWAATLTVAASSGAAVTCTSTSWHNPVQRSSSRRCYVRLPSVRATVALTGRAVLSRPGSAARVLSARGRPVEARGRASATPSLATVEQIERCWNTTPYVRLTFDDGGSPAQVRALLATLRRNGVRGTFFFRGDWAAAHPALLRAIRAEGHEVGNHSYDHPPLSQTSDGGVLSQIDRGLAATTTPRLLRPPFGAGALSTRLVDLAASRGYRVCRWTVDTYDWDRQSVAAMTQRIRYGDHRSPPVRAGGNILLHGTAAGTVTGLQAIIDTVRSAGLVLQPR